jgi:hypothetical protein
MKGVIGDEQDARNQAESINQGLKAAAAALSVAVGTHFVLQSKGSSNGSLNFFFFFFFFCSADNSASHTHTTVTFYQRFLSTSAKMTLIAGQSTHTKNETFRLFSSLQPTRFFSFFF